MTVRVYKSTDVGAPSIGYGPDSITTLLDAVLVNGYGAGPNHKPPLGWTRQVIQFYTDTGYIAYTQGAGSGGRKLIVYDKTDAPTMQWVGGYHHDTQPPAINFPVRNLHCHFENNANEVNGRTGTWTGTAAYTTGRFGSAAVFDAANECISFANTDGALSVRGFDFTLDFWIFPTGNPSADQYVWGPQTPAITDFMLTYTTARVLSLFWSLDGGTWAPGGAGNIATSALPLNTWSHIAVTRFNGQMMLFLNGALVGSASVGSAPLMEPGGSLTVTKRIGAHATGNQSLNARVDELLFTVGEARYTAAFTAPAAAYADRVNTRPWVESEFAWPSSFAFTSASPTNNTIIKPVSNALDRIPAVNALPTWVVVGTERSFWLFTRPSYVAESYYAHFFGDILNTAPNVTEPTCVSLMQSISVGAFGTIDNKLYAQGAGAEAANRKTTRATPGGMPFLIYRRGMQAASKGYPTHEYGTGLTHVELDVAIDSGTTPIGTLPGISWCPHVRAQTRAIKEWETVNGLGDYAGKVFNTVQLHNDADPQNPQLVLVEVSDTWEY